MNVTAEEAPNALTRLWKRVSAGKVTSLMVGALIAGTTFLLAPLNLIPFASDQPVWFFALCGLCTVSILTRPISKPVAAGDHIDRWRVDDPDWSPEMGRRRMSALLSQLCWLALAFHMLSRLQDLPAPPWQVVLATAFGALLPSLFAGGSAEA